MAATAGALAPLIGLYCLQLWHLPDYRWPMVAALLGAALVWWRRRNEPHDTVATGFPTIIFALAPALVLGAAALGAPSLAFLTLLVVVPLVSLALGGRGWLCRGIAVGLVLTPLAQLPFGVSDSLERMTRTAAARGAGKLLDLWGVFHVVHGDAIRVSDRRLRFAEAANGPSALVAVMCMTAFLLALRRRPILQSVAVLISAPVWTVVAESGRMAATARLADRFHFAADHGLVHGALIVTSLAVGVVLSLSFGELLRAASDFVCRRGPFEEPEDSPRPKSEWATPLLVVAAMVAILLQTSRLLGSRGGEEALLNPSRLEESAMPSAILNLSCDGFRDSVDEGDGVKRAGRNVWDYRGAARSARLQVEQGLVRWTQPLAEYRADGWIAGDRSVDPLEVNGRMISVVTARLSKPSTSQTATLWIALFESNGASAPGAISVLPLRSVGRLSGRELVEALTTESDSRAPYVGVRVFVEGLTPLETAEAAAARAVFAEACGRVLMTATKDGAQR